MQNNFVDSEEDGEVIPYLNDNVFLTVKKVLVSWQGLGTENYYNRIAYEIVKELEVKFNIKEKVLTWEDFREFKDSYERGNFNKVFLMEKDEQLKWFLRSYPQIPINKIRGFIQFCSIIDNTILNPIDESEDF